MLPVLLLKLCRKSRGRQINAVGFAQVVKESSSAKEVVSGHKWPGKIPFVNLLPVERWWRLFWATSYYCGTQNKPGKKKRKKKKERKKECSRAVSAISEEDATEELQEQDSWFPRVPSQGERSCCHQPAPCLGFGNVNRALDFQSPSSCFYFKLKGATQNLQEKAQP